MSTTHRMFRSTGLFVGLALSLLALQPAPAAAAGVTKITSLPCVITAPGQYKLATSLTSAVGGAAIDIQASNVHLNLAGNTLAGPTDCQTGAGPGFSIGIQVGAVSNVHINGGTVGGGFVEGITLVGTTNSHVNGMVVTGNCIFGIRLNNADNNSFNTNVVTLTSNPPTHCAAFRLESSDGNKINGNDVVSNGEVAFCDTGIELLNSNDNTILGNNVSNNDGFGIRTLGDSDGNTIQGNTVFGNRGCGILLLGNANFNLIQGNTVTSSLGDGIKLNFGATGNTVKSNTSTGNGFRDMFDGNLVPPPCSNNWTSNTFGTAGGVAAACIS